MSCSVIIAECGNNHEGDMNTALEMIDRAKEAGADLVKFQAGTAEGFARTPADVQRYRKYELGRAGYDLLIKHANEIEMPICFSVWSEEFADYRKFPLFKLAARQYSQENIRSYARWGTFVSIPSDVPLHKVKLIGIGGATPLHCVSEYPTFDAQLLRIPILRKMFGPRHGVGFSDHTIGIKTAIAAVHLFGATVIEKHFTLAHDFGPLRDHRLSATPDELRELVMSVKG